MIRRLIRTPASRLTRGSAALLLGLTFALSAPTTVLAQHSGRWARNVLESALLAWKQDDVPSAVRLARDALREPLTRRQQQLALHILCVAQADHISAERALPYCDRAVEMKADRRWQPLVNRAHVRMKLQDWEGAAEDYDASLAYLDSLSPSERAEMVPNGDEAAARRVVAQRRQLALRKLRSDTENLASQTEPAKQTDDAPASIADTGEDQPAPPAAPAR